MINTSTDIKEWIILSHVNSLNIWRWQSRSQLGDIHKHMAVTIQVLAWWNTQTYGGAKPINTIPTFILSLFNWPLHCIARSLVLYACFVDRCLSFCTFPFVHCVVCSSSMYRFWLPPFGIFKLFVMSYTCRDNRKITHSL